MSRENADPTCVECEGSGLREAFGEWPPSFETCPCTDKPRYQVSFEAPHDVLQGDGEWVVRLLIDGCPDDIHYEASSRLDVEDWARRHGVLVPQDNEPSFEDKRIEHVARKIALEFDGSESFWKERAAVARVAIAAYREVR